MAILGRNRSRALLGFPWDGRGIRSNPKRASSAAVRAVLVWLLLSVALSPLAGYSQSTSLPEAELKALFIQKFPNYIDWPKSAFENKRAALRIGVLDSKEIYDALTKLVAGKTFDKREIVVVGSKDIESLMDCHVVFIGDTADVELSKCFEEMKKRPILTIGESPDFTRRGGIIRLFNKGNKLGIEINAPAYKTADLKISSKLLGLANVVSPEVEG